MDVAIQRLGFKQQRKCMIVAAEAWFVSGPSEVITTELSVTCNEKKWQRNKTFSLHQRCHGPGSVTKGFDFCIIIKL